MSGLVKQKANEVVADGFIDPAEFLFKNTEYHDCFLIITDTVTKTVEKIGAISTELISRSSRLKKIFQEKQSSGLKHVEINDVSLPVVKLMLTYIYGGKLPAMDRATRPQLALAARAYDLRHLEEDCCDFLVPSNINEVFPALVCVAHLKNTTLLPHVTKIIQEKTDEVIKHGDFSKLDSKCLEFIASQDKLAIDEVELWRALVMWSGSNKGGEANRTARDVLGAVLQFVRLASFTHEQIIKEVVPSKILTDFEIVQLLSAVSTKTALDCPALCSNSKERCELRGESRCVPVGECPATRHPLKDKNISSDHEGDVTEKADGGTGKGRGRKKDSQAQGPKSKKDRISIHFTNLPVNTSFEELQELVKPFGPVKKCFLGVDRDTGLRPVKKFYLGPNGRCKGFGFVHFKSRTNAEKAIEALNGLRFKDQIISVVWTEPSQVIDSPDVPASAPSPMTKC